MDFGQRDLHRSSLFFEDIGCDGATVSCIPDIVARVPENVPAPGAWSNGNALTTIFVCNVCCRALSVASGIITVDNPGDTILELKTSLRAFINFIMLHIRPIGWQRIMADSDGSADKRNDRT